MSIQTPRFIDNLERRFHGLGIENLGIYLVILQAVGFMAIRLEPGVFHKFILIPDMLLRGEIWRAITFVAMPLSYEIWIVFALFFLYFIMQVLEQTWGPFKTTLFIFTGIVFTIAYSLATGMRVTTFMHMEFGMVFAVAIMYPQMEILLWGLIPIRMWMLGLFYFVITVLQFKDSSLLGKGYYLAVFGNYFLFFGLHHYQQVHSWLRRRRWKG